MLTVSLTFINFARPYLSCSVQELGPRFTLKMRWLQQGSFDTQFGEYEWLARRKEQETTDGNEGGGITRKKFAM